VAKPTEIPGLGPDTPMSVAGPLLVRGRLEDVRRQEAALATDGEPDMDAVHDARIATRRLRAAIALFGRGDLAALEDEVKALQDALGEVRDCQVQRRWFARRAEKGRGEDGVLVEWAGAGVPKASKQLRRALLAWRGAVAPSVAQAATDAAGKGTLQGKRLAKELRVRLRVLKRRLAAARDDPTARAAHRLRIAAKKLRYTAELVRPGFPAAADRMLDALVPLQDRLGDLHDTDVRLERLERLARKGTRREQRPARATLAALREERAREERALRRELARWRDERIVRALRRGLTRPESAGALPPQERARRADTPPGAAEAGRPAPSAAAGGSASRDAATAAERTLN
jgi:CHAD domain-containing protein